MRFNAYDWKEVKPNAKIKAPQGRLRLRASKPSAFFVTIEGCEALAGCGYEVDITAQGRMTFFVEAPEGTRVFLEEPTRERIEPKGEVFTNLDRKPMESGSVQAVRQAMRDLQLMQMQHRKEMAAEARAIRAQREAAKSEAKAAKLNADNAPPDQEKPKEQNSANPAE